MDYNSPDTDLLELLKIYKNPEGEAKSPKKETKTPEVNLDDDGTELNNFTIKMYIASIVEEQDVIKELRLIVSSAPDPDLANSLASLEKSLGDKMKMLAELSMHKGRIVSQEKLKANDNAIKKEIALLKIAPPKLDMGNHNTINIVATREEILKMALEQSEKQAIGRIVEDELLTSCITADESQIAPDSVG